LLNIEKVVEALSSPVKNSRRRGYGQEEKGA